MVSEAATKMEAASEVTTKMEGAASEATITKMKNHEQLARLSPLKQKE